MWSRVYSVGVGLLKLSKLSGGSSWMGDCPAACRLVLHLSCYWKGDCCWKGEHYFHGHGRYSVKLAVGKSD